MAGFLNLTREKQVNKVYEVEISRIIPNPNQPRTDFKQSEIVQLAESIANNGILQPLSVRRIGDNFELIAGERRLRAAKMCELHTVPCIIYEMSDRNSAILALVENIQRQNLSFMEAINNVFPYIQLPLKFKETPAHGELYVYEKKKALQPSDNLSALLHLELEALGVMDIFITLAGTHVTTRFSMSDKESGNLIQTELPKLTDALALKGYTLQSEVTIREPETENTPTLLEQFLEEHAPGGLNRYTFDIRA